LTAGAVLLKVTFILEPQVDITSSGESPEFFYISPAPQGWHERSPGGVCDNEIQTGGIASGIVAP